jgi:integrase
MKRRDLIAGGLVVAYEMATQSSMAQTAKRARLGYLSGGPPTASRESTLGAFSELIGAKYKAPATWGEIAKVEGEPTWIIGGSRMKAKKTYRIPLSSAAMGLLGKRQADNVPLFKATSEGALRATLKACDGNGYHVHGFRTSLQDWGVPIYGAELMDMCIAHGATGGKVRKAYQRGDRLSERRPILQKWSGFVAGK